MKIQKVGYGFLTSLLFIGGFGPACKTDSHITSDPGIASPAIASQAMTQVSIENAVPQGVVARVRNSKISLSWRRVRGSSGYQVYRGTTPGSKAPYKFVRTASLVENRVPAGTRFYYQVATRIKAGTSQLSAEVTAITAPPAVAGFNASNASGMIELRWQPSAGASAYNIYRGTRKNRETLIDQTSIPYFRDNHATIGTPYFYKVAAANESGASKQSGEVSSVASLDVYYDCSELRFLAGTSNDISSTLQNCINAFAPGGTLSIPPGSYVFSKPIFLGSGRSIKGNGTTQFIPTDHNTIVYMRDFPNHSRLININLSYANASGYLDTVLYYWTGGSSGHKQAAKSSPGVGYPTNVSQTNVWYGSLTSGTAFQIKANKSNAFSRYSWNMDSVYLSEEIAGLKPEYMSTPNLLYHRRFVKIGDTVQTAIPDGLNVIRANYGSDPCAMERQYTDENGVIQKLPNPYVETIWNQQTTTILGHELMDLGGDVGQHDVFYFKIVSLSGNSEKFIYGRDFGLIQWNSYDPAGNLTVQATWNMAGAPEAEIDWAYNCPVR